jgi:hypothetical protein
MMIFLPLVVLIAFFQLHVMEKNIDDILGTVKSVTTGKKFNSYWIVLSFVPIPFGLSLLYSFANKFFGFTFGKWAIFFPFIQLAISIFAFYMVYKLLSKGAYSFKVALVSAVWAAVAFEITKYLFLFFLSKQASGPLATGVIVTFLLVWLWLVSISFIYAFCARIGYYYQFMQILSRENHEALKYSNSRAMREISLICLVEMTKRFYSNNKKGMLPSAHNLGLDVNDLCNFALITPARARDVIFHLNTVGLVQILQDSEREIAVLRFSPDSLTLEDFISRIEGRTNPPTLPAHVPQYLSNKWFWSEYSKMLKNSFGGLTLKDLLDMEIKGDPKKSLASKNGLGKKPRRA